MNYYRKHLAVLLPTLNGGGAERTMLKLATGMSTRGYKVDLVIVHYVGPLISEIPKHINVINLKAPRALTSRAFSSLPALISYLRREQPDILYTGLMTNLIALWAVRLAQVHTRVVVSERNTLSVEVKQFPRDIRFRLMPLLVKEFYPWADCIVAVSEYVADDLSTICGIPREKIKVVYNPVVTPELEEKVQIPLEHPWFHPGQPPVILAVGRLTPQKDYPTLLRAFAQVNHRRTVRLLILGEGEERNKLEMLARELGIENDLQLPGFIANPYPYMKRASLFVLSSQFEGLPGVLIEALYCGAPVIATDCPGGSREILANGKYGRLVPVGDPVSMANAIEEELNNHDHIQAEESWKPFEREHILDQYEVLFNTILSTYSQG